VILVSRLAEHTRNMEADPRVSLLAHEKKPSREQINEGLRGNLCRCTGYSHIIDAVNYAANAAVSAAAEQTEAAHV